MPATHAHAYWLVLACDLPFLDAETLRHLLRSRVVARAATAYRSSYDGLPEPLCAIWEPRTREPLALIALEAGFADQSHFTTIFHREMGVTPGRFRAELA